MLFETLVYPLGEMVHLGLLEGSSPAYFCACRAQIIQKILRGEMKGVEQLQ